MAQSPADPVVEKVSWSDDTVWIDKAQITGFQGVREEVWNFHIGGYQVLDKYLKSRKGRKLTLDPKNEVFVSDSQANAMLTREYRKGFEVPAKV